MELRFERLLGVASTELRFERRPGVPSTEFRFERFERLDVGDDILTHLNLLREFEEVLKEEQRLRGLRETLERVALAPRFNLSPL